VLVSCIMPTHNRREMVPIALRSYLAQDWPEKELVVVDDGPDVLWDLFAGRPGVHYVRLAGRRRIGAKRNLACQVALGEVIVHFDSDDWSASGRIRDQIERLLASGKAVSGYHSGLFYDPARREASKYIWDGHPDHYSLGTALCYRRDFWRRNQFTNSDMQEDNDFVDAAKAARQLVSVDGGQFIVARIHAGNTCNHVPLRWPVVPIEEIPDAFLEACGAY